MLRTAKSTFAFVPGIDSRLAAPKTTIAPRGALRLRVDTEACDENELAMSRALSESLKRTRTYWRSLASTPGVYFTPTILAISALNAPAAESGGGLPEASVFGASALLAPLTAPFGSSLPISPEVSEVI